MPKSKVNKEQKINVKQFKNQQKTKIMSEINKENLVETLNLKPFKQVPVWDTNAKFEMTGAEFLAIQNFFNMFIEPIAAVQNIFRTNLNNGVITIKYQGEDGAEIPKEEIEAQLKKVQDHFASQKENEEATSTEVEDLK